MIVCDESGLVKVALSTYSSKKRHPMNKKSLIGVSVVIVLVVAYWLISPIWITVRVDEALPAPSEPQQETPTLSDATAPALTSEPTPEPEQPVVEEPTPQQGPTILGRADLVESAHAVEGSAMIVQSGNESFLRFEDLNTINGPDLRIYLSSSLDINDSVDLGPIRATQGNVNYPIPAGTDLSTYKNVLIWCRAFRVLFSYATLP